MNIGNKERFTTNKLAGPWRITFDTNPDDCNMSCIMCEEHSEYSPLRKARLESNRPHRRMDMQTIRKTVRDMVPMGLREVIPSTMGEPLLYEQFEEILEICAENNVKLNLTTNGTWPRYGPKKWAELICPVTRDVKVSWNGASVHTQESIMKGSSLDRRIRDLKEFVMVRDRISSYGGNRCSITLQVTYLEKNLTELPDIIKLAIELGLDRVKGHHLWVHFPEVSALDMRRSTDSIIRWNRIVDECKKVAEDHLKKDGTKIKLDNFERLDPEKPKSMPETWICPFLGREAWVNWEGRFDPCCAPDTERKKLGYFGNIDSAGGMANIWKGPQYNILVSSYMQNETCKKCTLRRPAEEVRIT